jgi:ubiquitin-protein ligase E3 C
MAVSGPWPLAYLRLEKIMLSVLDRCAAEMDAHLDLFLDFLTILHFVVDQIPSETSQNAEPFYRTFASVITKQCSMMENFPGDSKYTNALKESLETVITPLKRVTGYTLNAYEAFGYNILPLPLLATESKSDAAHQVRESLAASINYKLLANALATSFKESGIYSRSPLKDRGARLRLLGTFISRFRRGGLRAS